METWLLQYYGQSLSLSVNNKNWEYHTENPKHSDKVLWNIALRKITENKSEAGIGLKPGSASCWYFCHEVDREVKSEGEHISFTGWKFVWRNHVLKWKNYCHNHSKRVPNKIFCELLFFCEILEKFSEANAFLQEVWFGGFNFL